MQTKHIKLDNFFELKGLTARQQKIADLWDAAGGPRYLQPDGCTCDTCKDFCFKAMSNRENFNGFRCYNCRKRNGE